MSNDGICNLVVGGMLTKSEILRNMKNGNIKISNFNHKRLNPNSYNVTLNKKLIKYKDFPLDPKKENVYEEVIIPEEGLVMNPGDFYLGFTNEYTESHELIPGINGRSSIGRLSIAVHQTAGFGDIGFCGNWTLELYSIVPVIIYPNMEIGQIFWYSPCGDVIDTYNGKYQNAYDVQTSQMYLDFK